MIGEINSIQKFKSPLAYVRRSLDKHRHLSENELTVLCKQNISADHWEDQVKEMEDFAVKRSNHKHKGKHFSLSAPPGEEIPDEKWQKICREYMHAMGYKEEKGAQFIAVLHKDKDHHHAHIIANRTVYEPYLIKGVDTGGKVKKAVDDGHERYKSMDILRVLERKYGITQYDHAKYAAQRVLSKGEGYKRKYRPNELDKEPSYKKTIYDRIESIGGAKKSLYEVVNEDYAAAKEIGMPKKHKIESLIDVLEQHDILAEVRYKDKNPETGKVTGLKLGIKTKEGSEMWFGASSVCKDYSFKSLEKHGITANKDYDKIFEVFQKVEIKNSIMVCSHEDFEKPLKEFILSDNLSPEEEKLPKKQRNKLLKDRKEAAEQEAWEKVQKRCEDILAKRQEHRAKQKEMNESFKPFIQRNGLKPGMKFMVTIRGESVAAEITKLVMMRDKTDNLSKPVMHVLTPNGKTVAIPIEMLKTGQIRSNLSLKPEGKEIDKNQSKKRGGLSF